MNKQIDIRHGNNIDLLALIPDNSIDSIVTDPPYGINFLSKDWDSNTGEEETYRQCFRVLKPGGFMLAFSAARTYHHLAMSVERAGFEVKDQIMWIYGSGFPKAQDVGKQIAKRDAGIPRCNYDNKKPSIDYVKGSGKDVPPGKKFGITKSSKDEVQPDNEWAGFKTGLKPAHEPIVVAQKPREGTYVNNCETYGVGAFDIDGCRVSFDLEDPSPATNPVLRKNSDKYTNQKGGELGKGVIPFTSSKNEVVDTGRYPANVITDGSDVILKDFPNIQGKGHWPKGKTTGGGESWGGESSYEGVGPKAQESKDTTASYFTMIPIETEDYQKFFYCPKVNKKERQIGCDDLETKRKGAGDFRPSYDQDGTSGSAYGRWGDVKNNHPTVKPVALMKYLTKLVTPSNRQCLVLDPFMGSGSTGMAVVELGHNFIGMDLDKEYCEIAQLRIEAWRDKDD